MGCETVVSTRRSKKRGTAACCAHLLGAAFRAAVKGVGVGTKARREETVGNRCEARGGEMGNEEREKERAREMEKLSKKGEKGGRADAMRDRRCAVLRWGRERGGKEREAGRGEGRKVGNGAMGSNAETTRATQDAVSLAPPVRLGGRGRDGTRAQIQRSCDLSWKVPSAR